MGKRKEKGKKTAGNYLQLFRSSHKTETKSFEADCKDCFTFDARNINMYVYFLNEDIV